jgi:hypothetical protein
MLAAALALAACERTDATLQYKLDMLQTKLDNIEKALKNPGGRPGPAPVMAQPQQQQGPDPNATYSVPLDNGTARGPANAKVTIVEASDFA